MLSYGSPEWLENELHHHSGPKRFACPVCGAEKRYDCKRKGGYDICGIHKERWEMWKEYCNRAPKVLAWAEDMALPYLTGCIEEYLVGGRRPKRRKTDIAIAQRRIEELRMLLGREVDQ